MNRSFFFQLIRQEDGSRSEAVSCMRSEVSSVLDTLVPKENRSKFFVLVLIDDATVENWKFSTCPLFTVEHFLKVFSQVSSTDITGVIENV